VSQASRDLTELLSLLDHGDSESLGRFYSSLSLDQVREMLASACGFIRVLTDDIEIELDLDRGSIIQRFALAAQLDDGEDEL
jgi:hypothetical protein